MKKIPTLFKRIFEDNKLKGITPEITDGCEWVLNGEGLATRKWDGTCVLINKGIVYKRYDAKNGKTPPDGFVPAQLEPDPITGHWPGWLNINEYPDKWILEAVKYTTSGGLLDLKNGTYEAVGPKINGNKDNFPTHMLVKHGDDVYEDLSSVPLTFGIIESFLKDRIIEGIVFHHPDGRMAKIKRSDFGFKW